MDIVLLNESVTFPKGFKATGKHIGIKSKTDKKDLALISSDVKCNAAGCFTQNIVRAAPVIWDESVIKNKEGVYGIVINSGNANAATGQQGHKDCAEMAETYAKAIHCKSNEVLVCSTGVIGVNMPMLTVKLGIANTAKQLSATYNDGMFAAQAIMTTDTYIKNVGCEVEIGDKTVKIGGMSKGSGMIHPNMATLLGFITTDCAISTELLQKALLECVDSTFNMITVDGDTSTNDTVLVLANGCADNTLIETENKDFEMFKTALLKIAKKLAIDIAKDGEGATKLMEVTITGAKSEEDAKKIAKAVTGSSLFKSALFGEDANWGRVLCAMGYSGGKFNPEEVSVVFRSYNSNTAVLPNAEKSIVLMDKGVPIQFDESQAKNVLKENEIFIDIELKEGSGKATAWGCDLSYDYVKINGDYRS